MCMYLLIDMGICTYWYVYVHVHVLIDMFGYVHVHLHVLIDWCGYICTCTYGYVWVCMCTYWLMWVDMYMWIYYGMYVYLMWVCTSAAEDSSF